MNPSAVPVLGTLVWRSLESKAKRASPVHYTISFRRQKPSSSRRGPSWDAKASIHTIVGTSYITYGRTPFFFSCPGWHRVHHSPVQFHVQQQLCRGNEPPSNFNHCYFGNKRVSAMCGTVHPRVKENPELSHYLCMPSPPQFGALSYKSTINTKRSEKVEAEKGGSGKGGWEPRGPASHFRLEYLTSDWNCFW